jgi:hypothetical protein
MKMRFVYIAMLFLVLSSQVLAEEESEIGKTGQAGGFIFYDKGTYSDGWRYLEAARSDLLRNAQWSKTDGDLLGTTKMGIGEGEANTKIIASAPGHEGSAAERCAEMTVVRKGKTYDDYFLPSKDELNLMYINLKDKHNNVGGFSDNFSYWSSSEHDRYVAWSQDFYDGKQNCCDSKAFFFYIRCARAF